MSFLVAIYSADLLLTIIAGVAVITTFGYAVGCLVPQAARRHFVCAGALLASVLFLISAIVSESLDVRNASIPVLPAQGGTPIRPVATSGFNETAQPSQRLPSQRRQPAGQIGMYRSDELTLNRAGSIANASQSVAPQPVIKQPVVSQPYQPMKVLCLVWALGTFVMLLRLTRDLYRLRSVIRNAAPSSSRGVVCAMDRCRRSFPSRHVPKLLVSDLSVTPFSTRFPHLSVVLPMTLVDSFTEDEIEQVLRHELAHIDRGDQYWLILQRLMESLFWFLPPVFLNGRLLHEAREQLCDNHVLQHHQGHSYGATLLRLVESLQSPVTHRAANEIASSRRTWLRKRIVALVRPDRDVEVGCPVRTRIVGLVVVVGVSFCMGLFSLSGDPLVQAQVAVDTSTDNSASSGEQRAEAADLVFTGIVLDANSNPVSDALVILETRRDGQESLYSQTNSDKAGEFSVGGHRVDESSSKYLWAFKRGHSVRCVCPAEGTNRMILPPEEKIRLQLSNKALPSDLTVRPYYYEVPNGRYTADESSGLSNYMPPMLVDQLVFRPDENGTVTITGVTKKLLDTVLFESKTIGQQTAPPRGKVHLRETGRITGEIAFPPGHSPKDLTVYLNVYYPPKERFLKDLNSAERPGWTAGMAEAKVDAEGRFEVEAIVSGKLRIGVAWPAFSKFQPRLVGNSSELVVKAGEELTVQINAEEAVEVRGRVVLDDTGEPVAGAKVNLRVKDNSVLSSSQVSTDSDGWYTANMLPGDGTLQCYGLPGNTTDLPGNTRSAYQIPPISDHFFGSTEDGPLVLKEIRLKPKEVVAGVLLDAAGEPVRDRIIAMTVRQWGFIAGMGKTDDSGRFQWTLDAYKIGLLKAEYERISSVPTIRRSDSTPHFILLPTDVEGVNDLKQISQAMVDWKELPQARLESDIPLRLRLVSEPTR